MRDGKLNEMADNIILYWITASAAAPARLYWESFVRELRNCFRLLR